MPQTCIVHKCSTRSSGHRFPKDEELRKKWVVAIKRNNYVPKKYSCVCKKHFLPSDYMMPAESFIDNPKPRLKKDAVPSQFYWTEKTSTAKQSKKTKTKHNLKRRIDTQASNMAGKPMECRACLQKIDTGALSYNIFKPWTTAQGAPWTVLEGTIADNLARIAKINITETDNHSKIICQDCCLELHSACQFISTVRKSDQILTQRSTEPISQTESCAESDKVWPKPIQIDNVNGFINSMEVEIKREVISDEEDGVRDEADLMLDIKVEPEEIVDPLPIKVTVNGTISMDEMNAQGASTNGCEVYENEEYLEAVKEEPVSEDESEQTPDLPLECLLCSKSFHSMSGLKAHVIAQHSYKTVRTDNKPTEKKRVDKHVCSRCHRSFMTSTDLMVHETCHNKWVCYGCSKQCDSFDQLSKHRRRCKPSNDLGHHKPKTLKDVMRPLPETSMVKQQETLQCSLCPQKFSDRLYLTIHYDIKHSKEQTDKSDNTENSDQVESERRKNVEHAQKNYDRMETELESIFGEEQLQDKERVTSREQNVNSEQTEERNKMELENSEHTKENDQIKDDHSHSGESKENLRAKLSLMASDDNTETLESMLEAVDSTEKTLIEIKIEGDEYKMETELGLGDT